MARPTPAAIRSRNRLLGWAGWVAAAVAILSVVGALLSVVADLTHHDIAGGDISDGYVLAAKSLIMGAAMCLGAAFIGPRSRRRGRLLAGAVLYGLGSVSLGTSTGINAGLFASHHVLGSLTAETITASVAEVIEAAAFLTGAVAFRRSDHDAWTREHRLAVGAVIYAVGAIGAVVADVLGLVAASNVGSSSTSIALDLASALIELSAAIVVAYAFFGYARGGRSGGPDRVLTRDRFLAGAFSALLVANLAFGIGSLVEASNQDGFVAGLDAASNWLSAAGGVTVVAAFGCAAAAWCISGWRAA